AAGKFRCGSGPTCSILAEQQQPPRQNSIRFLGRPDRARQDPGTRQNLTLRWPRSRASYYDPATKNRSSPLSLRGTAVWIGLTFRELDDSGMLDGPQGGGGWRHADRSMT